MSVNPGDFYVVSGAPSSGKSVLLRIVLGLEPADINPDLLFSGGNRDEGDAAA